MDISFQKQDGEKSLGVDFFWRLEVRSKRAVVFNDKFIPDLHFDYFFVDKGEVRYRDQETKKPISFPQQAWKFLHTRPLVLEFITPIVLYGTRLSLNFASLFWGEATTNSIQEQGWVSKKVTDLGDFSVQTLDYIRRHKINKFPRPIFSKGLKESDWLMHYSARHKRRLYKNALGISRKDLMNIKNLHIFLEQTCDFGNQNPRIIQHVTPDIFYDQPHLNHAFKKMTEFSPVEYFENNSILQDNLMSASYNENPDG